MGSNRKSVHQVVWQVKDNSCGIMPLDDGAKMDGGGLNGSMMDPMTMSDAELLEPPPVPPAVEQPVAEKNSEEVKSNNSAELKVMEEKLKKVEMDKARMATEIEKQKSEILNLRDSATKLTKENADLNEKAELNEDELIDLREQFGEMEKEAEQNTLKQKELETEKAKLQESLNAHTKETENLKESQKTLEEKIKSHELELTEVRSKLQESNTSSQNMEVIQEERKAANEKVVAMKKLQED